MTDTPLNAILRDRIDTPVGPMVLLARDGVLLLLEFDDAGDRVAREMKARFGAVELVPASDPFGLSTKARAYFAGDLAAIDGIATDGGGTEFERRVWADLKAIPCGTTQSYGDIARRLGVIGLSRAVGIANARNPIAIVVPCHRVIGADGSLTGYGGGLERKRWLLAHEHATAQGDLFTRG